MYVCIYIYIYICPDPVWKPVSEPAPRAGGAEALARACFEANKRCWQDKG